MFSNTQKASFWVAALMVSLLFPAVQVWADEKKDQDLVTIQVPIVLVTASRVLQDLFELPMTVNVITAEDIKREPVTNITDILATVPGVTMQDPGLAGGKRVSIRGEDVGRTLIMINGIKTVDKRAGQSAIMIDASQIERIEIIKGPASVLYGPEAIGGVINIITKKGGDKPVGFSQNVVLDSSTNSADLQTALFGSYNGFNYRFSASGVNVHDRKFPDDVDSDHSAYQNRYYSGQLGYDWDKGSFSIRADQYVSNLLYSGTDATIGGGYTMEMPENDRESIAANLELRDLSKYLAKLTINGAYQNSQRNMLSDFKGMPVNPFKGQVRSDQDQYSFTALSEWTLGDHYLTAGVEYEFDDVYVENITYFYNGNPTNYSWADVEQDTLGAFLQDEWSMTSDMKLTMGLRQTWVESKFIDKEGTAYAVPPKSRKKHNSLVGSTGLVYSGIDDLALRFQWSQGNRYPTVSQLFTGQAGHGGGAVTTLPNPDLEPEESNSYEVGARFRRGGWDVDGAVFYTKAKNFIDTYTVAPGVSQYFNAAKADTVGAEMSLGYAFQESGLKPYTSVTWLRRENTTKTGFKTTKTQIPKFQGRTGLKWQTDVHEHQRFFTDLYLNWATDAERQTTEGGAITHYPAWQTLNFTLGLEGGEDHKYNASLSLRNIGNQRYVTSRGTGSLPEPGFHIVLGLGFEY